MAFDYTSGNPDNLIGGQPASMTDIRGPFGDLKTFLNSGVLDPITALKAPVTVLSNTLTNEVGVSGQVRAGRDFISTDFTGQGLGVPVAGWNLGSLTDWTGNGRTLVNKGSVPFGVGIGGAASSAAVFSGSTAQALYIVDTGAADPFRIRTGSWGCWLRTAKRGVAQDVMSKWGAAGAQGWLLEVDTSNVLRTYVSTTGSDQFTITGITDVADDRWHFAVVTFDGTRQRTYVDGALDFSQTIGSLIFAGAGPLNIGSRAADSGAAATSPFYGRIDEAFVTNDILSDDQIRYLYCAKIAHTLAQTPGRVNMLVRRRRRGGAIATTDFPTTPTRLHPFTAGSLNDLGSGGVTLTSNPGTGAITAVADADGSSGGAYSFSGAHAGLSSTDAGLPSGTASRSYGCWLKCTTLAGVDMGLMGWGTLSTADARLAISVGTGTIKATSAADNIIGPVVNDGLWHHVVAVDDNAAADGVKRKLYMDGRNVGGSTVLNSITLGGANRFRVAAHPDGTQPFTGQVDDAFVHAGALTAEQVRVLYNKGSQTMLQSPKDATDHVEAVDASNVYATFDTIEASDSVDLIVAP